MFMDSMQMNNIGKLNVRQDEMQKIVAAQRNRQRSQSVAHNAPQLQPIKNFGHGRRSNLVQKVQ